MFFLIHFVKNPENDVSYLALKSTHTTGTITRLNISKNSRKKKYFIKNENNSSGNNHYNKKLSLMMALNERCPNA
jgi:hypothetical protein